jgi:hypothetical protein
MLRSLARLLTRLVLGPAAVAGRQELDAEARLAMAPRALENELQRQTYGGPSPRPRRVGHLLVYKGGRESATKLGGGLLGRPTPLVTGGRRTARGATEFLTAVR